MPSNYEDALEQAALSPPLPAQPRPSAAVALWRRAAGVRLEVFWVKRAPHLRFMGGWHSFPGGGLLPSDAGAPVRGPASSGEEQFPAGLLACAVRELFEETGVLLYHGPEGPVALSRLRQAQQQVLAEGVNFGEALRGLGVTADASRLVFAGRWVTPPFSPIRFDARFFLAEWPGPPAPEPAAAAGELADGEWISPEEALQRWERGEVLLAQPMLEILRALRDEDPKGGWTPAVRSYEGDYGESERIEFRPGLSMIPLASATLPPATHTNVFLLGEGELVLVDPGASDAGELQRLHRLIWQITAGRQKSIRAIWLTHHHRDHVAGAQTVRGEFGAPIYAHPETASRLRGAGVPVDGALADGEVIELRGARAGRWRVIHTPGHARGHLCFYEETLGSLLAGDMVSGVSTIVIDPPEGNMEQYLSSLEKLIALRPRVIFPAHGQAMPESVARLEAALRHRLDRERRVQKAWEKGLRTPAEMAPAVYDTLDSGLHALAERQIAAHLERLRERGAIR